MLVLDSGTQKDWQKAAKQESSAAQRQDNLLKEIWSNSITVKDDAGFDVSNLLAQMGKPMASADVQRKLKLVCPSLDFLPSKADPSKVGIYLWKDMKQDTGGFKKERIFLFGMESGFMPEFSVLHKTKKQIANPELFGKDVPTREVDWLNVDTFAAETRGWRTVLLRLLHLRIISESDVETHFGWLPSRESEKWSTQTR